MAVAEVTAETRAFNEQYHFLIRRLHSLSGIIPVGAFLCVHMLLNGSILMGGEAFQNAVALIHSLDRVGILKAVEVVFIFMPIAFHAIVGLLIWLTSNPNALTYRYGANIRYTFQRWTGIIALLFIVLHLWHVHWIIPGSVEFDAHAAPESVVSAMAAWWCAPVYAIGLLCAVFHLANGVWTFLITWGVTIGPKSQVRSGYACVAIGMVLGLLGLGALIKIKAMDVSASAPPPATIAGHAAVSVDAVTFPYA